MSDARETVIIPVPYGHNRTRIEVYYKDPETPERKAQLSAGMTEAKVRLAAGAKVEDCMILVKQIAPDNTVCGTYLYCDGELGPYHPDHHKLGSCCQKDDPESDSEPEYEPIDEVFDDEDAIEDELLVEEDEDNGVQDETEEPAEDKYQGWGEEDDEEEVDEAEVTDDEEDNETVDEDTPST